MFLSSVEYLQIAGASPRLGGPDNFLLNAIGGSGGPSGCASTIIPRLPRGAIMKPSRVAWMSANG